jgi:hypothetical protein
MGYLRVKNWEEFQHYKDRNPPWIKLHRTLLDDYEFSRLQDASKAHLMLIWLFASQKNGRIPDDPAFLKRKLGLEKEPNLKLLVDHGLLIPEQNASESLADCNQVAPREETEKRQRREVLVAPSGAFLRFWSAWPKSSRKQAQGQCWRVWMRADLDQHALAITEHLESLKASADWLKDGGQYVPAPLVYLNQRRWEGAEAPAIERKQVAL